MAVGDHYRATLIYNRAGVGFFGETVHNYRQISAHVQSSPTEDLATALTGIPLSLIMDGMSNQISLVKIEVRGITNNTEGFDLNLLVPTPGGQAGEAYDWALGLQMVWRTGLVGRWFRGRSTFGPTHEAAVTAGGLLDPTFRGNTQVNLSNLINIPADATNGEWQMVIVSRFLNGVERPIPVFTPVTTGELQERQGILKQRRS